MVIVVMLIAIMAMMGVALMNLISLDNSLVGQTRRSIQARSIAEGGTMEVINTADFSSLVPRFDAPTLSTIYTPVAASVFSDARCFRGVSPKVVESKSLISTQTQIQNRFRFRCGDSDSEVQIQIRIPIQIRIQIQIRTQSQIQIQIRNQILIPIRI